MANRANILHETVSIFDGADTPARLIDALETIEVERMRTNNTLQDQKAMELSNDDKVDLID